MANAATGWMQIFCSANCPQTEQLKEIIDSNPKIFSYDCEYELDRDETGLCVHFTSRWTSDPVWDLIDKLMIDSDISTWLQSVKIIGAGREDGARHLVKVKKKVGDAKLTRLYT
jgi:hypothetical protein